MSETRSQTVQTVDSLRLWRLGGLSLDQLVRESLREFKRNRLSAACAQFAYFSLLALAPLLILLISAVSRLPIEGLLDEFREAVAYGLPQTAVEIIHHQLDDIQRRPSPGLMAVSLVVLAYSGSKIFWTIGKALDVGFAGGKHRRPWVRAGISLALTFGNFVLLLAAMVLLVAGPMVVRLVITEGSLPWISAVIFTVIPWVVATAAMLFSASLIYWLVPSADVPWHWFSPGSVFATAGWMAVMSGFRLYVENFGRYNETHGALAGIVVLMTWLYLTGAVLLTGGLINGVIYRAEMHRNANSKK